MGESNIDDWDLNIQLYIYIYIYIYVCVYLYMCVDWLNIGLGWEREVIFKSCYLYKWDVKCLFSITYFSTF